MNYPYMLVIRNSYGGMIWQAYTVQNDKEVELLTRSARSRGFIVQTERAGYTEETTPGWRDTQGWQDYLAKHSPPCEKEKPE